MHSPLSLSSRLSKSSSSLSISISGCFYGRHLSTLLVFSSRQLFDVDSERMHLLLEMRTQVNVAFLSIFEFRMHCLNKSRFFRMGRGVWLLMQLRGNGAADGWIDRPH